MAKKLYHVSRYVRMKGEKYVWASSRDEACEIADEDPIEANDFIDDEYDAEESDEPVAKISEYDILNPEDRYGND